MNSLPEVSSVVYYRKLLEEAREHTQEAKEILDASEITITSSSKTAEVDGSALELEVNLAISALEKVRDWARGPEVETAEASSGFSEKPAWSIGGGLR